MEQPGPWGRFALRESRLDPAIGAELERRAAAAGVSVLLVKQPGRTASGGLGAGRADAGGASAASGRLVFAASSRPGSVFLEALELDETERLLELDLEALGAGRSLGGEPRETPLFLVCTNGKRDACCARAGRPIAAALDTVHPGAVWECSHTGGHRFAGVLVCLPHGLVYGRLDPARALRAAAAYARGRIELPSFRGRASYEGAVQAADAYLRLEQRLEGLEDVAVAGAHDGAVLLQRADGARFAVRVHREEAAPPRPSSCRDLGSEGTRPVVWLLESIEPV